MILLIDLEPYYKCLLNEMYSHLRVKIICDYKQMMIIPIVTANSNYQIFFLIHFYKSRLKDFSFNFGSGL